MNPYYQPLIAIVGPTASGKTSIAVELAERYSGEIICADSRTIYKHLDIGTAKPSKEDQARVPHWGLDLVEPGDYFSAADFKRYATTKITEIRARGHVPFLVGGTGLYVDSILFDFQFGPPADSQLRSQLESMSLTELYYYCKKHNIILPENDKNKRYIIRAIERSDYNNTNDSHLLDNTIVVGITTDRETLRTRIMDRTEQLFEDGVVEEAKVLGEMYGWKNEAMKGNIYPLAKQYLENIISVSEMKEKYATLDWRLAKRQLTWLRRNRFITWMPLHEVSDFITRQLAIRD